MRTEDKKANETANTNEIENINEAENTEKQQVKSKVTPFRYPYNESEDPEIDAFILQGLQEEADEAEARVNSDPELSQINPPEDQYDKIVARLKEMGIWEEDEEEEKLPEEERKKEVAEAREEIAAANRGRKLGNLGREDLEREDLEREDFGEAGLEGENLENIYGNGKELPEQGSSETAASEKEVLGEDELYQMLSEKDREAIALGRRAQEKKKRRSRYMRMIVKRGGIVAAAFVLLIGVSMNVSASRQWIVQMWGAVAEVFATRTVTNSIEEDKALQSTAAESLTAMEEIEEQTGIPGLDFNYWPEGMEYLKHVIFDDYLEARVFYTYKESSINVYMKNTKSEETSYYVSDENLKLVESIDVLGGIEAKIWEENAGQATVRYRVEFSYEDYRYIILGVVSLDEIEKLVENMNFLSKSS